MSSRWSFQRQAMSLSISITPIMIVILVRDSAFAFSLGSVTEQLLKRIEQTKFPRQTCDVLVIGDLIDELELSGEMPITSFLAASDDKLTTFQSFLTNHLKCLIAFATYKGAETIPFMNTLLERKPNSLVVFVGSKPMENDANKRWKPFVYIHILGMTKSNDFGKNHQIVSMETKCPDSMTFTFDFWKSDTGFFKPNSNPFASCKHPFEGNAFMMSIAPTPPNVLLIPEQPIMGTDYMIMKILSEKFKFKFGWTLVASYSKNLTTNTYPIGTAMGDVSNGVSLMSIGGSVISSEFVPYVDFTSPHYIFHIVFTSRNPQPIFSSNNILQAFDQLVWGVSYISLLAVTATFSLIYYVYQYPLRGSKGLIKPIRAAIEWIDFLILPFSKFLNAEPITWFPKRLSSGMLLVQFWSFFTMFLIFFYTSNLQADLVRKTYEKPLNTLQDVLDRNKPVYITDSLPSYDYKKAVAMGFPISDIMIKISKLAHQTNGYVNTLKYGGNLPPDAWDDIIKNGASYLNVDVLVPYNNLFNKSRGNMQNTKEDVFSQLFCFYIKKYSPWKEDVDIAINRLIDSGITKKLLSDPIPIEATIKWSPKNDQHDNEPLNMNQLLLAFYIMGAFYFLSIFLFLAESLIKTVLSWLWPQEISVQLKIVPVIY